jgi:ABC-2 type transport system ATP-binding protein
MEYAIDVRDLRRSYGELEAVRGVSFTVMPGEVFCLLGPNGAGKTTTVEILEGYRARTSGSVSVLGFDPAAAQRALRERVGIVLQETGVPGMVSVGELLRMFARYYPRPRPVGELLALVGLEAREDTRVAKLSGGQRRRLDLALALVGDPDLIFLDEPTTGFDPSARRAAWDAIRALCGLGKTVFLTTHFMDEAQALADRVAVMRDGAIVACGPPAELGGRDTAPTEIRFALPPAVALSDLPALPGATIEQDEPGHALVTTAHGVAVTHVLSGWALEHGHELGGFSVAQPTLEDVYLELTA